MMNYYDIVLGLIPLSVLGISGTLFGVGVNPPLAVAAGSVVAAGLIGHAMFVRTPVSASGKSGSPAARGTQQSDAGTDTYSTAD